MARKTSPVFCTLSRASIISKTSASTNTEPAPLGVGFRLQFSGSRIYALGFKNGADSRMSGTCLLVPERGGVLSFG
jgi:hypothetical protein